GQASARITGPQTQSVGKTAPRPAPAPIRILPPNILPGPPGEPHSTGQTSLHIPPVARATPGDLWADNVIGKRNFAEVSPLTVVPNRMFWNHGVIVDRGGT